MPVTVVSLPWKDGSIFHLGDSHDGTKSQARKKVQEAIYIVKSEKKSLWVHTGDAAESIMVDDPRYEWDQHTMPVADRQVDSVVETFYPIRKQLLKFLMGNHEWRVRSVNMLWGYCKGLGRIDAYGAWTSMLTFADKGGLHRWKGLWTHGPQRRASIISGAGDAGQQVANEQASLKKILAPLGNAHYMGCGHFHKLILRPPARTLYLDTDKSAVHRKYTAPPEDGYVHPDFRWYGCNGGFLKSLNMSEEYPNTSKDTVEPISYAERAGYPPVEMGMVKLNIRDYKLHSCEVVTL